MTKAKDAFRTISEVAEWLDTPTHVLRFWESKFSQIKPVKGAGGRRYYRPADMELLGGIKKLLHEDGLTIKGTQKLLREKGVKYIATLGPSTSDQMPATIAAATLAPEPVHDAPKAAPVLDMLPLEKTPPSPTFHSDLPDLPASFPGIPGRLIGRAPVDASALRARAAQIVPLLGRLEDLRERMRTQ
jgi:DNA-binding transcriptional MerR regulator